MTGPMTQSLDGHLAGVSGAETRLTGIRSTVEVEWGHSLVLLGPRATLPVLGQNVHERLCSTHGSHPTDSALTSPRLLPLLQRLAARMSTLKARRKHSRSGCSRI